MDRHNFLKRRLKAAVERTQIPVEGVNFRMLRRSFATLGQVVGLDVKAIQSQLGHARPDLTAGVYMQPIDQKTAEQIKLLEDMLAGRVPWPVDVEARLGKGLIQ
jgi:integrase